MERSVETFTSSTNNEKPAFPKMNKFGQKKTRDKKYYY